MPVSFLFKLPSSTWFQCGSHNKSLSTSATGASKIQTVTGKSFLGTRKDTGLQDTSAYNINPSAAAKIQARSKS
jgi:hypothetical protein